MKFICRLFGHKWCEWQFVFCDTPMYIRRCSRCGEWDRRKA
jgi:hypothetical protein